MLHLDGVMQMRCVGQCMSRFTLPAESLVLRVIRSHIGWLVVWVRTLFIRNIAYTMLIL